MKVLVKYEEDFGRMGDLESIFVAEKEEFDELLAAGEVYLGELLGKHSEITGTLNAETLKIVSEDQDFIEKFKAIVPYSIGVDVLGRFKDQQEE